MSGEVYVVLGGVFGARKSVVFVDVRDAVMLLLEVSNYLM